MLWRSVQVSQFCESPHSSKRSKWVGTHLMERCISELAVGNTRWLNDEQCSVRKAQISLEEYRRSVLFLLILSAPVQPKLCGSPGHPWYPLRTASFHQEILLPGASEGWLTWKQLRKGFRNQIPLGMLQMGKPLRRLFKTGFVSPKAPKNSPERFWVFIHKELLVSLLIWKN